MNMTKTTIKLLNDLLGSILEALPDIEEEASKLEDRYSQRSDKWAESDTGTEALEKLESLKSSIADLQSAAENIESIVSE